MLNLYGRKNGRLVDVFYPVGGNKNVLKRHVGTKVRSGTGPNGRYVVIRETGGKHRSLLEDKVVKSLS